jgi:hypothetical protein
VRIGSAKLDRKSSVCCVCVYEHDHDHRRIAPNPSRRVVIPLR